jgi:hypothetical protein
MRTFEYRDKNGETRAMAIGFYTETIGETVCVFDIFDRLVAVFTPQPGEYVCDPAVLRDEPVAA